MSAWVDGFQNELDSMVVNGRNFEAKDRYGVLVANASAVARGRIVGVPLAEDVLDYCRGAIAAHAYVVRTLWSIR